MRKERIALYVGLVVVIALVIVSLVVVVGRKSGGRSGPPSAKPLGVSKRPGMVNAGLEAFGVSGPNQPLK